MKISLRAKFQQSAAAHVMQEISYALKDRPQALVDDMRLRKTLEEVQALDRQFEKSGGRYFYAGSDSVTTGLQFTQMHLERYRQEGRPSLPALAVHHADLLGFDKNSPAYKALIRVAVRAEMRGAVTPAYHNRFHYMDVAAMTANFLEKNNEMVKAGVPGAVALTPQEQVLTFIAAIGHDLDHPGRVNPSNDPFFNEQKSFEVMKPLLQEAGLSAADIDKVHTILMTTSPDGPHAVMKAVAHAYREGRSVDSSAIGSRFLDLLHVLQEDRNLTQMAAIVSDSDLYASSGAGMKASDIMSGFLSKEQGIDLTTDKARKFFLDNIVGKEGYASNAGRAVGLESLEALRRETDRRLAGSTPKPPMPGSPTP